MEKNLLFVVGNESIGIIFKVMLFEYKKGEDIFRGVYKIRVYFCLLIGNLIVFLLFL